MSGDQAGDVVLLLRHLDGRAPRPVEALLAACRRLGDAHDLVLDEDVLERALELLADDGWAVCDDCAEDEHCHSCECCDATTARAVEDVPAGAFL